MRNALKRYYGRGDLHFVTFSCYRRRPLLATPRARNCFVKILDRVRCKQDFLLLGFVVMPEHVRTLENHKGAPPDLHAREPGEAGAGFASQTLAVEQLATLRAWRAMCAPCGLARR